MTRRSRLIFTTAAAILALYPSNPAWSADQAVLLGEPVNLGPAINSADGEGSPKISRNGLELFFNSKRPGGSGGHDLWVARRSSLDAPWEPATNLGTVVNSPANEGAPTVSADGLELYFHDWGNHRPGGIGKTDIWMSRRETQDEPWGEPVNLGEIVNSPENDGTPEISADGLELYFESERPGGFGSDDLWVSRRETADAPWSAPENLGPAVNTAEWEHCANISADGLTLFFDVRIPGDLLVSKRASGADPWKEPENLGHEASDHWASSISSTGDSLYFAADRPGGLGGGDIWQVPVLSGVTR